MAASKHITLITGANGGIGFELAAQLLADATRHVLLGSRSREKGEKALSDLQSRSEPGSVELLLIDVDSPTSILEAAKLVKEKHGRLDALVNNAAIAPTSSQTPEALASSVEAAEQESSDMAAAFKTNAIGPMLVGDAFLPLLKKSITTARIVNISSGAGSITSRLKPAGGSALQQRFAAYRCSKAALNMVTANQAVACNEFGAKVFAFCPGFTVSNLSGMNKAEMGAKPTSEGTRPIVDILNGKRDDESAKFLKVDGQYGW